MPSSALSHLSSPSLLISPTLGHVLEEVVAGQVDVVDDLAPVLVEVRVGQGLQVVQGVLGNVTLPLEFAC